MVKKGSVYFGIVLIFLVTGFISGCTTQKKIEEPAPKLPVSFHHYFSGALSGGINEMVAEYNQSQSNYQLNVVPIDHEAYKISIIKSLEENNPTDLNSYWAGKKTEALIQYLEPLDDVFIDNDLNSLFEPTLIDSACIYEGTYYLLPITQHYVNFFYNIEVFQKLGIEEPKSWGEFLKVCEKLKQNHVVPIGLGAKDKWPAQFWFDYILLRTAGNAYRDELFKGEQKFTDPQVIRVMEIWKNLLDNSYFNENITSTDWGDPIIQGIINGDIGMTLNGTWLISGFEELDAMEKIGVFSFPMIDKEVANYCLGPVDGIIIGKDAINKEGAKDVLIKFAQVEFQTRMAIGSGGFSPNINTSSEIYSSQQLELLKDIKESEGWAFNFDLATTKTLSESGLDFFVDFLNYPNAYNELLESLESKND